MINSGTCASPELLLLRGVLSAMNNVLFIFVGNAGNACFSSEAKVPKDKSQFQSPIQEKLIKIKG